MIAYFDSAALVPLVIQEASSEACRRMWDDADDVVCSRIGYVEVAAALAQAVRSGRMTDAQHDTARTAFDDLWPAVQTFEIDQPLVEAAARCAAELGLRGYDAVHAATAQALGGDGTVACTGDKQLLAAWQALGLATVDMNAG